jgi:hypothetical protein
VSEMTHSDLGGLRTLTSHCYLTTVLFRKDRCSQG